MTRDRALATLQRLRPSLEARGIAHAGLFGSVARGQVSSGSDIDIVVTPSRNLDLIDFGAVQTLLDEEFGCDVDIVVEPVRKPQLRAAISSDRADAF
jgi:predicted nucleotidyltransferase